MANDFLVAYLDSIDEDLLQYLDEELSLATVKRLRTFTTDLLAGIITPLRLMDEWPDWFILTGAYVASYGTEDLEAMEKEALFLDAAEEGRDVALTPLDRAYLRALALTFDTYPEIRRGH